MSIMSSLSIEKTKKECFFFTRSQKLLWCNCAFVSAYHGMWSINKFKLNQVNTEIYETVYNHQVIFVNVSCNKKGQQKKQKNKDKLTKTKL